jgi:transketolase
MQHSIQSLQEIAQTIRRDIVEMVYLAGSGHPGGSLSAADILTVLYYEKMNVNAQEPQMVNRDRFVLSKGHAAPVLYSTLARKGYFDVVEMKSLRKVGAMLQGHPDMKNIPGVEMSTGSLGQGFSTSVGMALANKLDKSPSKTYVLLGDGELNEGIVWEAAMSAAQFKLDSLVAILDYNKLQIDGRNDDVMGVHPVDEKFRSFGWHVIECDGHDLEAIYQALVQADTISGKPTLVIANTLKGKGVSFMEDQVGWHGKAPSQEEFNKAMKELGGADYAS